MLLSRRRSFATILLGCLILGAGAYGRPRKRKASGSAGFSYYLLVLSYAPNFCDQPQGNKDPRECGAGRHIGFVVHGLWPQAEDSRGPENCAPASPVAQAIVQATLRYMPTESLIQHEWAAHGTCSGLSAGDYFAALRKARDAVSVPSDIDQPAKPLQLSPGEIESKLAAANPAFPRGAIRTSCYRDRELQEIRVCLDRSLSPRVCGSSAGECTAPQVSLLPVH